MKKVEIIIKPSKLEEVRDALSQEGVTGMTVYEVKGYGRQKGHTEIYRGAEHKIEFVHKVKIDLILQDDKVDPIVQTVLKHAPDENKIGSGKIFISSVEKVIRIRTGEENQEAI